MPITGISTGTGLAIAGGASFLGGLANIFSNNAANRANAKAIERANRLNYEAQKEFYQNSIQWRKQDALNAGINPIYALGAQGAQFSPSFSAAQQTPNNYNFIGNSAQAALEYYNMEKQLELQQEQAAANINRDNAQAELFRAQRDEIQGKNITTPTKENITTPTTTKPKKELRQITKKDESLIDSMNSVIGKVAEGYEFVKTDSDTYVLAPAHQYHQDQLSEGIVDKWNFKLKDLSEFAKILNENGIPPSGYHYERTFDGRLLQEGIKLVSNYETPEIKYQRMMREAKAQRRREKVAKRWWRKRLERYGKKVLGKRQVKIKQENGTYRTESGYL